MESDARPIDPSDFYTAKNVCFLYTYHFCEHWGAEAYYTNNSYYVAIV